ncbi:MAG TPA: hypothetical protein DCK99_07640 [Blastocatellia bacterium]|jgi:hypothetical protein|nr:hypothetical protein [Blastocatellia bacterium]
MQFEKGKSFQLIVAAVLIIVVVRTTSAQPKDRVIEWSTYPLGRIGSAAEGIKPSPVTEALEIVDMTVAGRSITVGQPFAADKDWLRSLTFRMRNVSGQPITGARIGFDLPETKTEDHSLGFSLEYGKGLSTGIPSDEQKVIMPNEEFELKFNEAQYERHRKFVAERSTIPSFSKVWIGVTTVKFEDGSSWASGCLRSANPSNSCTPRAP